MAPVRPACWLLAAALCLCPVRAARAYASGADSLTTETTATQAAAGSLLRDKAMVDAALAATPDTDSTPPLEITATPRSLLLYIPFHVSEPASHLADLCNCTLRRHPWRGRAAHQFDVLLSISGRASAGNEAALKTMLEQAVAHVVPRPRVFVEFVQLRSDRYVLDVDESQKDDSWVSGPNTAFYDALLEGHIFSKYVRHYALVQQLETDVCALADGWLADLTQPATDDDRILITGATIRGDCIYIKKDDRCESSRDLDDHMRQHVNGNALYRISADLTAVLAHAKTAFSNAEPFDLAIYWVMQARGMKPRLHSNRVYLNLASLVDNGRLLDPAYYGGTATMVHVPRRLRTCEFRAVASRGFVGLPLTVITVHGAPQPSLARLVKSLERLQIDRYVLMATSEATFVELSRTYPFRVLAAFSSPPKQFSVATPTSSAAATYKLLTTDEYSVACAPWNRQPASPTGFALAAVGKLVRMGYAPFVIDQRALIFRDYELALFRMDADGVYVTDSDATWSPALAAGRGAAWLPSPMFFPPSEASTADAMAVLADSGMPSASLPALKTFPPDEVTGGGPYHDLAFPLVLRGRRLARMPGPRLPAYDVWQSRTQTNDKLQCANYTVAGRRSLDVRLVDVGAVVRGIADAVATARARSVACVVLPSLVFHRRSVASIFRVVDGDALAGLAGGAVTLVPSVSNIDTDYGVYVELEAEHARKQVGNRTLFASQVRRVLDAAADALGRDYVCVHTVGAADTAAGLRQQVDGLQRALKAGMAGWTTTKLFLRGPWRHLGSAVWATATSASVRPVTLAHVRAMMGGPATSMPAQRFATGDAVAFDEAWADAMESAVCAGAARTVTVTLEQAAPSGPACLAGLSPAAVDTDLAQFSTWLRRPERRALRGPFVVAQVAPPTSCPAWARAARQAALLAYAAKARHVVLPPMDDAWRGTVDVNALHGALPNVLPTSVARLLQPGLTFDGAPPNGRADDVTNADRSLSKKHAAVLSFVRLTKKLLAPRSVLWTANVTDASFSAMRFGLRSWDWIVVNVTASDNALLSAVLVRGGMMDGLAYQRRVDAVMGGVCGGGVVASLG